MAGKRKAKLEIVYLDTNFWIYYLENHPKFGKVCQNFLKRCLNDRTTIITSALTLTEIFVLPIKESNIPLIQTYHQLFSLPNIQIIDINQAIAFEASKIRATYNFSTPDCLHLSTAIIKKCQLFVSDDDDLKKIKDIKVISTTLLQ